MTRDWNEHYATGEMPWDRSDPDPELVRLIENRSLPMGRALDVGCGTGPNARYLASLGYEVLGLDLSPLAIERAEAASSADSSRLRYETGDFLQGPLPAGEFQLVFDRGCFHCFDDPADRARFADRVAACLSEGGLWISLLGSTEGPERDHGPPRRSVRDIAEAVEPALEFVELRRFDFELDAETSVPAWTLIARRRAMPAQPSSVHTD